MKALVIDVEQRSPAWFAARCGRLTSTGAMEILAELKKGGEPAGRRNLRIRLALEQITGKPLERDFSTAAMADGVEREPEALAAYEAKTGELVTKVGFLQHPTLMAGTSLDGMVDSVNGIIEIKCPEHNAHLEALQGGAQVPEKYLRQVIHHLWISGAEWCDWMSYQPDFPEHLRTVIVRVHRDTVDLTAYELAATTFLREVTQQVETIQKLHGAA